MGKAGGSGREGGEAALHFWEILTLFPRISDTRLEERIDHFIMRATPEELLSMSRQLFDFVTPLLMEDERLRAMMRNLSGKRIALNIEEDYYSVVTLAEMRFSVVLQREDKIPAVSVVDRAHYRDALLKRADPLRLILERKIRVRGLATLFRWAWPHRKVIRDRSLYQKYLGYQGDIEKRVSEILASMGY